VHKLRATRSTSISICRDQLRVARNRWRPEFSVIPVVLFSGSPELAETARELDVVAYAAKPLGLDQVLAITRK